MEGEGRGGKDGCLCIFKGTLRVSPHVSLYRPMPLNIDTHIPSSQILHPHPHALKDAIDSMYIHALSSYSVTGLGAPPCLLDPNGFTLQQLATDGQKSRVDRRCLAL